jgi:acyl carrier protein
MEKNNVTGRIKQIIIRHINPELKLEELSDATPLIGRGLGLDSVSLLELVVAIEADFDMRFDEKDMSPELFANVASIAAYVAKRSNHDN